jgi:NADH-quinone oxidoreductase subunit D
MDRTINVGSISAEQAISYGFTGPNLRAAGVDYDVRIAQPYSSYDDFDFIIPVGTSEIPMIVFVRNAEVWQSISIIRQALENEGNEFHADVPDYLPPKEDVYTSMESLIYHFL